MDKEGWFIVLFPTLITQGTIWYKRLNEGASYVNIFGHEVDAAVVAAIISGAVVILVTLLKYWFSERKQYKKLMERLGDFKERSLANILGVESGASITEQLGIKWQV